MRKSAAPSQVRNVANGLFSNSGHKRSIQSILSLLESDNKTVAEFSQNKSSIPESPADLQNNDSDCENNGTDAYIDSRATNPSQLFKVVWGKPSTKKHKTWEGDGFLELTMKSAILRDEERTILSTKTLHKPLKVEIGQILTIGSKVVEIIELCSAMEPIQSNKRFKEDDDSILHPSKIKKTALTDTVSSSSNNLCIPSDTIQENLLSSSHQVFYDDDDEQEMIMMTSKVLTRKNLVK